MTDRTPHADLDALVGRVQALEAGIHGLLDDMSPGSLGDDMSPGSIAMGPLLRHIRNELRSLAGSAPPPATTEPVNRHEAYAMDAEGYTVPTPKQRQDEFWRAHPTVTTDSEDTP